MLILNHNENLFMPLCFWIVKYA
ncbi:hypothetical protein BAE44_0004005 [Dichanthelium oligosanthes]|uniref:Uncharacterized protein n=1 Tax=Dichanthelium oligosanthes TaxID=888268 RepID=A0A1E5WCM5_9POAL|nr:hypothetical protein BAE44_0004005 [Dichanthelium oligosanthes]